MPRGMIFWIKAQAIAAGTVSPKYALTEMFKHLLK